LELKESLNDRKQENWDVSPTTKDTEFWDTTPRPSLR
jgi:hypothetical protein